MRVSYKNKTVLIYIIVIVVPCFVAVAYLNAAIYRSVYDKANDDIMLTLKQMNNSVDFKMNIYERVMNILCVNEDIQSVLSEEQRLSLKQDISDERKLFNTLNTAQYNHGLSSVRLYVNPVKLYANQNYTFFNMDKVRDEQWFRNALKRQGKTYWYMDSELINGRNVVKGVCILKSITKDLDCIGALEISIPLADFFSFALESNKWIKNTFVIDKDGKIIACDDRSRLGTELASVKGMSFPRGSSGKVFGKKQSVLFVKIRNTDWRLITSVKKNELMTFGNLTTMSTTITSVLCISVALLAFLLMYIFMNRTVGYIQKIHKLIDSEGVLNIENIDENPEAGGSIYDFDILEYKVNALVKELKCKIEDAYVLKINERNAMLKALQEQINPHFIYNTLDTLNWMALDYGVPEINEVISALAGYFRISLSKGRDIIHLREELDLIKAYLKIQKKRYEDRFTVIYDVDDSLLDYAFPKLILQPIVENALLHGLNKDDDEQKLTISVRVKREEEDISILVSDNGIGIDKETLGKIFTDTLHTNKYLQGGYGIYNVCNRIKYFCKEEEGYGLFINSVVGQGTEVSIKIKMIEYDNGNS